MHITICLKLTLDLTALGDFFFVFLLFLCVDISQNVTLTPILRVRTIPTVSTSEKDSLLPPTPHGICSSISEHLCFLKDTALRHQRQASNES